MDHVWIDLCYGGSWENVNGVLQYLPLPMNFELKLPLKKLTYKRLISLVSKKLSLERLSGFTLSYLKKGKVYLLNDNEDVDRFMCYISVSEDVVTLYVVEPRSSEVGSGTGSNQLSSSAPVYGTHDVQLNNCYQQQNFFVQPQFHHQEISVPPYFQYQTQYQTHTTQLQQSQNPQLFPNPNLNQFTDPNVGFHIEQLDDDEETDDFDLSLYPELNYVSDQILGKSQEEEEEEIDDFDLSQYPGFNDVSDQIWGKSQEEEETAIAEEDPN